MELIDGRPRKLTIEDRRLPIVTTANTGSGDFGTVAPPSDKEKVVGACSCAADLVCDFATSESLIPAPPIEGDDADATKCGEGGGRGTGN